ncbi:MAG TPA: dephospho-CoA kinase [Gemmatimonadales bacterium]|nr:dephospho-CoA kinase [Gemmatimonadales bacterium]
MLHVALTGNIAAGKSAVASLFREWGATVLDADEMVRALQQPGTPVFNAIVARFGSQIVMPDGTLDRAALRARILADPAERRALERIVHPAVRAERGRSLEQHRAAPIPIIVSDIPLLFEAADPAGFDAVVLVDAPEALRRERLVRERGLPAQEAEALLGLQLPAGSKRVRSDFVIDNDGTRDALRARAWQVWRKLISLLRERA